jgi:endonuclease/exonuclease/phosphatase family metal-dependent hydrolase
MNKFARLHPAIGGARVVLQKAALALFFAASLAQAAPIDITVMTRNVYFGANLAPLTLAQNLDEVKAAVSDIWDAAVASDPVARMSRIAQEITQANPHVVGLQEAVLWQVNFVPQFGGPFYEVLDALLPNHSVQLISPSGSNTLPGADDRLYTLADFDAIMVRDDVTLLNTFTDQFDAMSGLPVLGSIVPLPRSYGYVDVEIDGSRTRVFNTHTEAVFGPINEQQGNELIGEMNASPYPVIALGDFNPITDLLTTDIYENIIAAGYRDSWDELKDLATDPGFTWRNDPSLNDPNVAFTERLDFVFHRGGFLTLSVDLTGDVAAAGQPIHASDHLGVVATLRFVPEPGSLALVCLALAGLGAARRAVTKH